MIGPGIRVPAARNQAWVSWALLLITLLTAWQVGGWIANEQSSMLFLAGLGFCVCAIAVTTLRNWRSGFYLFLVWLLFEDLARKYLGNNMYVYFAKDILAGLTYISLFVSVRRGKDKLFRPPFMLALSLFFWLGVIQVFNANSPNILYGLLGLKLYFYYIPLMFVGYALIRTNEDLLQFLVVNMGLAGVVSLLGVIQGIVGKTFLNPAELAPEIRELSALERSAPISHEIFSAPTATFVSAGRFAWYLILVAILGLGATAYLLMQTRRGRIVVIPALGMVVVATAICGSRGALIYVAGSAVVLAAAFLWGAPWRWGQVHRVVKAVLRSLLAAGLALAFMMILFPRAIESRWSFYYETLSPESSSYELANRSWDYPINNFLLTFTNEHWVIGNGIGTGSLGVQYVGKVLGERAPDLLVENGFGTMIVELGILGPILWIPWTAGLLFAGWNIVRRLKGTPQFPLAFAIVWFIFLLTYPMTFGTIAMYENYVYNAYFWMLVGVLFRLPTVMPDDSILLSAAATKARKRRWLTA